MAKLKFTPLGADGKPIQGKENNTKTTGSKISFTPLRADGKPIDSKEPIKERAKPKPTLGSRAKEVAGEVVKSIVKPVATTLARPVQAVAALSGATADEIDAYTKSKVGDYVAPTPRNTSDVVKDVGRAAETVLTVPLGGTALKALKLGTQAAKGAKVTQTLGQVAGTSALEGAGYGAGYALEQGGTETTAKDFLKETAIGGAVGAVAPVAIKAVGKFFGGKASKVPEIIPETKTNVAPVVREVEEVIPTGKVKEQPDLIKQLVGLQIRAENPKKDVIKKLLDGGLDEKEANSLYDEMYAKIVPEAPKVTPETPKVTKKLKEKDYEDFDSNYKDTPIEDRVYIKSTVDNWVAKGEEVLGKAKSENTIDNLIDIVQKRPGTTEIIGLPNEALRKILQRDETLTTAQQYRLKNTLSGSESGAELRAMQIDNSSGIVQDKWSYIKGVEAKLKEKLNTGKFTNKSIINKLDDLECPE